MYISRLAWVERGLKLPRLSAGQAPDYVRCSRCAGQSADRWGLIEFAGRLLTLDSRRLELIALLPADEARETGRLPTQGEAEACHRGIGREIHLGTVLVARLVIALLCVFLVLLDSPSLIVTFELHSFVHRERWDANARQAEVIGAVEVTRLRARIRTNRQAEFFRGRLHPRIERCPLRS